MEGRGGKKHYCDMEGRGGKKHYSILPRSLLPVPSAIHSFYWRTRNRPAICWSLAMILSLLFIPPRQTELSTSSTTADALSCKQFITLYTHGADATTRLKLHRTRYSQDTSRRNMLGKVAAWTSTQASKPRYKIAC